MFPKYPQIYLKLHKLIYVVKLILLLLFNIKYLVRLFKAKPSFFQLYFLSNFKISRVLKFIDLLVFSKSQINQDLVVLSALNFKKKGYFVEFGAVDGIKFSNTYLLEKKFGWSGILVEPDINNRSKLQKNRNSILDFRCVWKKTKHVISFFISNYNLYSLAAKDIEKSTHKSKLNEGVFMDVETVRLDHLLDEHEAPRLIDYLSIDTEGSEFDILSSFNFKKYKFQVITVEHNYTDKREKIFKLLTKNGYIRKYANLSKFDDWYFLVNSK